MSFDNLFANLRNRRLLSTSVILFTLAMGVVIGTLITGAVGAAREQVAPGATPLSIPAPAQLSSTFVQVAKAVGPSVVNINVESTIKHPAPQGRQRTPRGQQQQQPQTPRDPDEFQDFFQRFFGGGGGGQEGFQGGDVKQRSLGSGIVVDPKGYILTNRHVVFAESDKAADRVRVKLAGDPTQYTAKVIGVDEDTDLAVIKIEPKKPLITAKMGNSESMNVGDWVLAIGSPFGLDATVTAGIISAKGRDSRDIPTLSSFQHFLQTDAAINPGNSGGPLVNMAGEVIGVNTAILTNHGTYEGVGFALPSSTAVSVYNQIIKNGRVMRGSIGIQFATENNPSALRVYAGNKEGVLVNLVLPDTPAEKAGVLPGDVILSVDGTPTPTGNDLVAKISETAIGQTVKLHLVRDGKELDIKVPVGDRAEVIDANGKASPDKPSDEPKNAAAVKFGIQIQNMNPELSKRMGITTSDGVVVMDVDSDSFAEDIGLARGDVIMEINRKTIKTTDDVSALQKTLKSGDDVAFKISRRGPGNRMATYFLAGQLP
jgi:serine protease Do